MPKGRRPNVPESIWEGRKEAIRKLYLDERRQLVGRDGVIEIMRKRGFEASNWQYQAHLERWNFRKKLTRDIWHAIKHALDQRRSNGLESIVYAYGSSIKERRVAKETQRYKACRTDGGHCEKVQLPTEIEIRSPQELALVAITTTDQFTISENDVSAIVEPSLDQDPDIFQCFSGEIALDELMFPQFIGNNVPEHNFFGLPDSSGQGRQFAQMPDTMPGTMPAHALQAYDECSNTLTRLQPRGSTGNTSMGTSVPHSTALLLKDLMPGIGGGTQSYLEKNPMSLHGQNSPQSLIRSPTHIAMIRQIMYILMNNFAGSSISVFYGMLEQAKQFSLSQLEDLLDAVPAPFDAALAQGLLTIGVKANIPRIVKLLLDRNIDINTIACHSESGPIPPLGMACKYLHLSIVRLLLQHKIDVNRRMDMRIGLFHSNSAMGNLASALNELRERSSLSYGSYEYPADACEIFRCLLQAGAHLDTEDLCKIQIWHSKSLLDIYTKNARHYTQGLRTYPMHASLPSSKRINFLIGSRLWLALNTVVFGAEAAALLMVKRLHGDNLRNGDSHQQRMDEISTILHVAASVGSLAVIEYCISRGVKVSSKDWCEAIETNQLHVLSHFIRKETDIVTLALSPSNPESQPMIWREMIGVEDDMRSIDAKNNHRRKSLRVVRTPFAEAYRFKNKEYIRVFQASGLKQTAITIESFAASFDAFLAVGAQTGDVRLLKFLESLAAIMPDFSYCFQVPGIRDKGRFKKAYDMFETATAGDYDECVHVLLNLGFLPGSRALKTAIARRNEYLVQLFLDIAVDAGNPSLLVETIQWGHKRFIDHLLYTECLFQEHSPIRYVDHELEPPRALTISDVLSAAMDVGNEDLIKIITEQGIRGKFEDQQLYYTATLLQMTIRRGRDDIAIDLLSRGANANDSGALVEAASRSRPMLIALLSAFRAQYPCGDKYFAKQALCNSIKQADLEAIRMLGSLTDLNMRYECRVPVIMGEAGNRDRVHLDSCTLFGEGIMTNDIEVVRALLDMGADANSIVGIEVSKNRRRSILAVSQAILGVNIDMVKLLCGFGATINFSAVMGITETTLQLAVSVDSYEIVEFLLKQGVDPNARPSVREGATAIQAAARNGNVGIADLLYEYHVDVNAPGSRFLGKTAFEFAAENGRMDMLLWLYHHGLDIFLDGGEQIRNALKYAEIAGQLAARDLVIQLAAEVGIDAIYMKSEWDATLRKKVQEQFEQDWCTWV